MSDEQQPAIQTVQRASTILRAFSISKPRLTLSELTVALNSTKATAHRYAKALREVGLLRYDGSSAYYTLGPQLLSLESVAKSGLSILSAAVNHMDKLLKDINQTVVLSVWDGETASVVRCVDNTLGPIRLSVKPGARLSLFDSAQGRVFCAYLNEEDVPELRHRLQVSPRFSQELNRIREQGISMNSPAVHGVRTIAAPILEHKRIAASLAVVGTAVSLSHETENDIVGHLKLAATSLSEDLGTPRDAWPCSDSRDT